MLGGLNMSFELGMLLTIIALVLMGVCFLIYCFVSYLEEKEHHKAMRRLARACNRDIRETERAIEDACLESMRRDGYMFRR